MADYNINAVTRRVVYDGSSGLGPYAFNFEILDQNDINVYFNTTLLTITTDYTVTINANGKGSVTIVTGSSVPSTPVAADQITIIGSRDIERTTDFVTAGDLRAAALNEQLDALTIFDQQISERVDRSVQFPSYEPAGLNYTVPDLDNRKSKYLAFDSNGELSTLAGTSAPLASVDTAVIVDNAVTTAKLASNSVTSAKIVDGTIATADIADDAITAAKFNISGNGTSGQVVQSDGDGSFSYTTLAFNGRLINIQSFTASGTYTPHASALQAIVYVQGAGGGGGGSDSDDTAQSGVGAGGNGGGYIQSGLIDVSAGSYSSTITVGAGGAGGANAVGADGADSVYNDGTISLTAKGGGGADRFGDLVSPNAIVPADTAANTVSNHTPVLNIGTNPGGNGISMESSGGDNRASGGAGGGSFFGYGGRGGSSSSTSVYAGTNGVGYGSGGGGAAMQGAVSGGSYPGGDGADGIIIIYEYT